MREVFLFIHEHLPILRTSFIPSLLLIRVVGCLVGWVIKLSTSSWLSSSTTYTAFLLSLGTFYKFHLIIPEFQEVRGCWKTSVLLSNSPMSIPNAGYLLFRVVLLRKRIANTYLIGLNSRDCDGQIVGKFQLRLGLLTQRPSWSSPGALDEQQAQAYFEHNLVPQVAHNRKHSDWNLVFDPGIRPDPANAPCAKSHFGLPRPGRPTTIGSTCCSSLNITAS